MLDKFIKSNFFEKKFFKVRKKLDWVEKRYRYSHGIGEGFENEELKERAKISLKILEDACLTSYEQGTDTKIIWIYWDSDLANAPEVVRLSYVSWEKLNPDYKVVFLNDENIENKLGFDFNSIFHLCNIRLTKANKADLLRVYLLTQFGGVWADATTFCLKPLSSWLPHIKHQADFFMFRQEEVKSRPLEVWFIYAKKGSPLIAKAFGLYLNYLLKDREFAIYVSNSKKMMRKLGYEKTHPDKIYAQGVHNAEKYGFMPYFTLAYFLNESMDELFNDFEEKMFFNLPNNFCNNKESIDVFLNSVVAKQTYKGRYQEEKVYLERKAVLLLDILGNFNI
ncbi:capsular polysaccharide synthesis protein [Halomonas sp. PAR7]|uniref:capsular polysaccharide synthesis protein n=1 Tax=Halomonas sp. PAR7 TaxID=3075514 RepID=UPI0028858DDE|nr:capsular polysaccharide synthesis protein [Halomonas sp. PAR7]MDT0500972.1 capsular polysaccharide synthesis protein [Halomonas sp. PAR7]